MIWYRLLARALAETNPLIARTLTAHSPRPPRYRQESNIGSSFGCSGAAGGASPDFDALACGAVSRARRRAMPVVVVVEGRSSRIQDLSRFSGKLDRLEKLVRTGSMTKPDMKTHRT